MTDYELVEKLYCIRCQLKARGDVAITTTTNGSVICEWTCSECGSPNLNTRGDETRDPSSDSYGVQDLTETLTFNA